MVDVSRWRAAGARRAVVVAALALLVLTGGGVAAADDDHAVVGRFSITSDAGGAVWAFQPGGLLVVTGPGDISSEGGWTPASGDREFDATVDYDIAGQSLTVQGEVAPDGTAVAIYVTATDPQRPGDAEPWPPESRLIGERFGMVAEATPLPSQLPIDCLRPRWIDGEVDWDRCDETVALATASPSPSAGIEADGG